MRHGNFGTLRQAMAPGRAVPPDATGPRAMTGAPAPLSRPVHLPVLGLSFAFQSIAGVGVDQQWDHRKR